MALTRNWTIAKDTLLAKDTTPLGGGNDEHLPVGYYGGYRMRSAVKFSLVWTGATQIVSAFLFMKTSTQTHTVSIGSDPDIYVERITGGNFTENSGRSAWDDPPGSGWSGSASDYDDISSTTTNRSTWDVTTSESTWDSIDITAIVEDWAPTTVKKRNGTAGGNQPNYGLLLRPVTEDSAAETVEFYSRKHGSGLPYIQFNYLSNLPPVGPTLVSPIGGIGITDLTPIFAFTPVDPDGDAMTSFELQVDGTTGNNVVPDWASLVYSTTQTGLNMPSGLTNYFSDEGGLAGLLSRGSWYAWRVRVTDSGGQLGAWSSPGYFHGNQLPSYTSRDPGSADFAGIHNLGTSLATWTGAGTDARPRLTFVYNDADGDAMTKVRVKVWNDNSGAKGTQRYDTGEVVLGAASGSTIVVDVGDKVSVGIGGPAVSLAATQSGTAGLVNGTQYWWSIEVWDTAPESSGSVDSSTATAFEVKWGQGIYEFPPSGGASSSQWAFTAAPFSQEGQGVYLFRTATGSGGSGASGWVANVGLLTPAAYLNVMVRLATQVVDTNTLLPDMTFSYFGAGSLPERWYNSGSGTISLVSAVRRYGTKSLEYKTAASAGHLWPFRLSNGDDIPVVPNTDYVLSAYVKTAAVLNGKAYLKVFNHDGNTIVDGLTVASAWTQDSSAHPEGWQRLWLPFNSGAYAIVRPSLSYGGSVTAGEKVYWDAVALTEGSVLPAWSPGWLADAVILDSNGIAIDASRGAIFRLRGISGGADDIIELGDNGLRIGSKMGHINAAIRLAKRLTLR